MLTPAETTKSCCDCGRKYPIAAFAKMRDGRSVYPDSYCRPCRNIRARAQHQKHRDKRLAYSAKIRHAIKAAVLVGYGNRCACCGETEALFLSVDHVNNDGAAHRAALGGRYIGMEKIRRQIIKDKFPPNFQVLCFNCNCAKGFFGRCPHERNTTNN